MIRAENNAARCIRQQEIKKEINTKERMGWIRKRKCLSRSYETLITGKKKDTYRIGT